MPLSGMAAHRCTVMPQSVLRLDTRRVSISIQVRSERHDVVAGIDDVAGSLPDAPVPLTAADLPDDRLHYPMLAYVDPLGDTCFNRLQTTAVLQELHQLAHEAAPGDRRAESRARAVEVLVAAHMRKPHTYLWFIGN